MCGPELSQLYWPVAFSGVYRKSKNPDATSLVCLLIKLCGVVVGGHSYIIVYSRLNLSRFIIRFCNQVHAY